MKIYIIESHDSVSNVMTTQKQAYWAKSHALARVKRLKARLHSSKDIDGRAYALSMSFVIKELVIPDHIIWDEET